MICWLPLLILATEPTAPMEHQYTETIFETDFGQSSDLNYDGWPDNWTRRRGIGFPQYVRIEIGEDQDEQGQTQRCLRIDLDGGGATAYSPPIEISPQFSFVLQGKLKTEGLEHNVAYVSLTFYDRDRERTETYTSDQWSGNSSWRGVQIGPIKPKNPQVRLAVVGLHLVPTDRSDLTGAALFDELRFARLPNMTIETSRPGNLFARPGEAEVTCRVSGIQRADAAVVFELLDVSGRTLLEQEQRLSTIDATPDELAWPTTLTSDPVTILTADETGHGGVVSWRPRFPDYGFYHIRATLRNENRVTLQQTIAVAVMRQLGMPGQGSFGWSVPRDSHALTDQQLMKLMGMSSVSWVKYPIWYAPDDTAEGDRIAALADGLGAMGIEMVGVFDQPPEEVFRRFGDKESLSVAEAFLEPDMWQPAVDPLMIRLALKIQWWQLGGDQDESFIDYLGLEQKVTEIRRHLKKFGQRTRLGLAWRWMHQVPEARQPPWDFLSMTESPSFTSTELGRYANHEDLSQTTAWVTLWPLPCHVYDYRARARDLILRMVQAKIDGMNVIFAGNPFHRTRGLLQHDGTPRDILLPWCITAQMIGGANYLGSLRLPNGSPNHVFARDGEAVMIVWNNRQVTESLFLGEQVVRVDPWGRETPLSATDQPVGKRQHIAVGPTPAFIRGLDLAVARWRLSFSFQPDRLASSLGRTQPMAFQFDNTLDQGVGGTLELHVPEVWDIRSPHLRFKLATKDQLRHDLQVLLHANASSGPQEVRIDFELFADKPYQFSVYRDIQVGMGDVVAELDTWLDDDGKLIVEQHLINQTTKRLDFNCYLFVPGRRRMRMQVFDIGPGRVTHTFSLRDGRELLGKSLWLRIEELGTNRLQNYHVVAEP